MTKNQIFSVVGVIALFIGIAFAYEKWGPDDTKETAGAEFAPGVVDVDADGIPEFYCSYFLTMSFGARNRVGAVWVESKAWMPRPKDEEVSETATPPDLVFMADLLKTLAPKGILKDLDFGRPEKDRLIIQWPGAAPKRSWILDTKFFEVPKQEPEVPGADQPAEPQE